MTPAVRRGLWPTLIVTALLGNVALGVVLMRVARADPSFAVEPDYYRKAVAWDSLHDRAAASAALGWTLGATASALGPDGAATLELSLVDSLGTAVVGADLQVEAMPVAFASRLTTGRLAQGATAGRYRGDLTLDLPGVWEVRIEAVRGTEQFTGSLRLELFADRPARSVPDRRGAASAERLAAGMRVSP